MTTGRLNWESRDLLQLVLEIRRRQVVAAFVFGLLLGMFIIEILRVSRVLPDPIGYAVAAGLLAILALPSVLLGEFQLRRLMRKCQGRGSTK